jgi:hypothetical protein
LPEAQALLFEAFSQADGSTKILSVIRDFLTRQGKGRLLPERVLPATRQDHIRQGRDSSQWGRFACRPGHCQRDSLSGDHQAA